jgi:hypothetical protein
MKPLALLFALLLTAATVALADSEAPNRPVVRASEYGTTYAKSVPDDDYGQEGTTLFYGVSAGEDVLLTEYQWFASEMYIGGPGETTLVRFGPWHRGREPQEDHLAIGLYRNGTALAEYSTLNMLKLGSGLSASVSHYEVFGERLGFKWIGSNSFVFQVTGVNGIVFSFCLETGEVSAE